MFLNKYIDKYKDNFRAHCIASFALGGISALAMAPANIWGALFVTLSLLYVIYSLTKNTKQAFIVGWLFGFGYFLFSLSWIGNALLVEGNDYKWAWPLAVAGLPFVLAFFPACAIALARRFSDPKRVVGFVSFVVLYIIFEWLRGHIFTGFPWNLFGYTWVDTLSIAQTAYPLGIYGLSFLTLLWASLAGFLYVQRDIWVFKLVAAVLVSFVFSYMYGDLRLGQNPDVFTNTNVKIIQANIAQKDKWDRNKLYDNLERHIQLSMPDDETDIYAPIIIVWPETAMVDWLYDDPFVRKSIIEMLSAYQGEAALITGVLRHDMQSASIYNSIVQINKDGEIGGIYDKSHLVPFGEYIPFQEFIPLRPITNFSGFAAGSGAKSLSVFNQNSLHYAPTICYEIIFSGAIIDPTQPKPDFILTVTNDAWYGDSAGPYQHYTKAVFRAIEEGTPVVRVANTGISGLISSFGREHGRSEILKEYSKTIGIPFRISK